jgi:hypothetical protein
MLLLYFIVAGLLLGKLAGGHLAAIGEIKFRWWLLALGGFGVQAALFAPPIASRIGTAGPALYVASTLAVLAALLRNVRLVGFPVIAAGAGINLLAIVSNGGFMPSSPEVWQALNGVAALPVTYYTNSALASSATAFPYLGDILLLPRPLPFANVFSLGDVLIGLGAAFFLVIAMRRPSAVASMVDVGGVRPDASPGPRAGQPGSSLR